MKMVQDYYDAKSSEDSAEELNKIDREEILTVTINGSSDAKERRKRREIANSNERRRMQSINAGFQTLRGLLPGNRAEKLSKAAILQKTADLIYQLKQDKMRTIRERNELKELLTGTVIAPLKRLKSYQSNLYHYHHHHHRHSNSGSNNGNSSSNSISRSRHHPHQRYEHHQNHLIESMSSDECLDDCLDDCLSPDEDPASPVALQPMNIVVEKPSKESSSSSLAASAADFNSFDMVEELRTKLLMERSRRLRLEDQIRHMDPNLFYPHPPEVHHVEEVLSNNSVDRSYETDAANTSIEIRHLQQPTVPKKRSRSVSPVVGATNTAVTAATSTTAITSPPLLPLSTTVTTVTNLPLLSPPLSSLPAAEITTALPFTLQKPQLSPQSSSSLYGGTTSGTSILEAVLKCEPKVEVESLLTLKSRPSSSSSSSSSSSLPSSQPVNAANIKATSVCSTAPPVVTNMNNLPRQNLETIVEAIRRLEGDMFSSKEQEQQQQQRPGVIVTQQKQQQKSQSPFV